MNTLVKRLEGELEPRLARAAHAHWSHATNATDAAAAELGAAERAVGELWTRRTVGQDVGHMLAEGDPEPLVVRQLELLDLGFRRHAFEPKLAREIVEREAELATLNARFRATLDGKPRTEGELLRELRGADDEERRRTVWLALKQRGTAVAERVRTLVGLRNDAAREAGFADYYAMSVEHVGLARLDELVDAVEAMTRAPFAAMKAELDAGLARRLGVATGELMPWSYDDAFFAHVSSPITADLDGLWARLDLVDTGARLVRGLGLGMDQVFQRSDWYPRPGKVEHAFCIDLDRSGDVRVLCNLEGNARSARTALHELGHAAYDRFFDAKLPFLLRVPPGAHVTEGVAMLFGRLADAPKLLRDVAGVPADHVRALAKPLAEHGRADLLAFLRFALVMVRFERELYRDPAQDLDDLWWSLSERLQGLRRPAGAPGVWAAKTHIAVTPAYYHNYVLGEVLAAQLGGALVRQAGGVVGRRGAGELLVEQLFRHGARRRWDDAVAEATGKPLALGELERFLAGDLAIE